MLSGGVALFDQPAGVVEYFLHEVLVHAAAEPAGEVVTRHRPVAVRHLEITAVVVDRQRGPVLEQVLVGGVTEREGSGELRFERQFFGVDLVGIGVQLFEISRTTSQQCEGKRHCGNVSKNILEFHNV